MNAASQSPRPDVLRRALAAACTMLLVTAACRRPSPRQRPELPTVGLLQAASGGGLLVQVYVIGIRCITGEQEADFPAPGFRLGPSGLAAAERPETAAGSRMTREQFQDWLSRLEAAGRLVTYMAPSFSIQPGRASTASNRREMTYPANCKFYPDGRLSTIHGKMITGTTLSVRSLERRVSAAPVLEIDLAMSAAALEWAPPSPPDAPSGPALTPRLALPQESFERLRTTVAVPWDRPLVVAHFAKQFRQAQEDGPTGKVIQEHLLCVVAIRGPGPGRGQSAPAVRASTRAAHLVWFQWEGGPATSTGPASVEGGVSLARVGREEMARIRRTMNRAPGAVACGLGMAFSPGTGAAFEVGKNQTFLAGIDPQPAANLAGPFRFVIQTVRAGMGLEVEKGRSEPQGSLSLKVRLADTPQFRKAPMDQAVREWLAERTPIHEFTQAAQSTAEARFSIPARSGHILMLGVPWRWTEGPPAGPKVEDRSRILLLEVREVPSPTG